MKLAWPTSGPRPSNFHTPQGEKGLRDTSPGLNLNATSGSQWHVPGLVGGVQSPLLCFLCPPGGPWLIPAPEPLVACQ